MEKRICPEAWKLETIIRAIHPGLLTKNQAHLPGQQMDVFIESTALPPGVVD